MKPLLITCTILLTLGSLGLGIGIGIGIGNALHVSTFAKGPFWPANK